MDGAVFCGHRRSSIPKSQVPPLALMFAASRRRDMLSCSIARQFRYLAMWNSFTTLLSLAYATRRSGCVGRVHSDCDMALLKLKIVSGIHPCDANLTPTQESALAALAIGEIIALAEQAPCDVAL